MNVLSTSRVAWRCWWLLLAVLCMPLAAPAGAGAQEGPAQPPGPAGPLDFGKLIGGPLAPGGPGLGSERIRLSGRFTVVEGSRSGRLSITAQIAPGWHTYALSQKGGPGPSKIELRSGGEVQLTGPFQPDRDPESRMVTDSRGQPIWNVPVLEHYGEVTWSAPIRLAAGVNPEQLKIEVVYNGQVCEESGSCVPVLDRVVQATFAGYEQQAAPSGPYRPKRGHIELEGYLEPKTVAPGGRVKLVLVARPDEGYHIYALADRDTASGNKPTLIALTKTGGWPARRPKASVDPIPPAGAEASLPYYEGQVSWTIELDVPEAAEPGQYTIAGQLAYQVCTKQSCDLPSALSFEGTVTVGPAEEAGQVPLALAALRSYRKVAAAAEKMQWASPQAVAAGWQNMPVAVIFLFAFLAGLILNVMPCVLPVIGLKIMSFVQQAGESRWRILQLNLWFSLGLLVVFWVLASVPVVLNLLGRETLGWGGQFAYAPFAITLVAIVFVFALSFLGVWEVPIPGFVGTGQTGQLAQREGVGGAFAKGVLATVLATPCTGPLLGPAVGWAVVQPPWLTYATFTFIGLGMALPYLLIGAFPKLIALLPKPGPWMETFKKLMGFVLLATVVWIFSFLDKAYIVPALALLLALGFGCWVIGGVPLTADRAARLRAWGLAAVVTVLVAIGAFASGRLVVPLLALVTGGAIAVALIIVTPLTASAGRKLLGWGTAALVLLVAFLITSFSLRSVELPWQPFSRAVLEQQLAAGRTVLVDFTADW